MFPFRELEVFDAFMLDGEECEKVGIDKYLTYDELHEPESLESADPNLMVELIGGDDEKEEEDDLYDYYFFSTLLSMIEAMEQAGETMTMEQLKELAITSLQMGEDP